MQQQDKEIFQGYEVKNWNFNPRIYKILGVATVFNLLVVFVMAQADIFTTRGCDSPMVSNVCQVLDTIYVGSVMLTTNRNSVDEIYEKTDLDNADITYIDVSNQAPPLNYPAGYFALANPESQFANMTTPDGFPMNRTGTSSIPGIPGFQTVNPTLTNPTTDLANIPQVTPTPNKKSTTGPIPTSPFDLSGIKPSKNPVPDPPKNTIGNVLPRPNGRTSKTRNSLPITLSPNDTVAETKKSENNPDEKLPETKSDPVADVEINKKPIKDLGVFVNALMKDENVKLNLETPFVVTAKGKLTKEGKLDPKSYKVEANSPDKNMVEVVQESIEAINDAGYLQYLKVLSGKDLNLELSQNDENITAIVKSELESDTRAKSLKSSFNLLIKGAKLTKTDPNDKDDLELLNSATVESDGKNLIIKFAIPKALAQEMIKRKLLEEANKPQTNNITQGTNLTQTLTK